MKTYHQSESFFHVCTDGHSNGVVHTCPEDYYRSVIISAVAAYRYGVNILCFCHMSSHSHFVISCDSTEVARLFIETYKREYARYLSRERGIPRVYYDVSVSVSQISDYRYLKNCISYVLLNPVTAGICKTPEEYPYSSFDAYFSDIAPNGKPASGMTVREMADIFKTNLDLSKTSFLADNNNHLVLKSFVDYVFVESLLGCKSWFYKSLALTNCIEEEMKYAPQTCRFNDMELIAEALELAQKRYGKIRLQFLTHEQKLSMIPTICRKTRASGKRMARILRLPPEEVETLLGTIDNSE